MITLLFLVLFGDRIPSFFFALCKRGVGFRITTAVLIVAIIGEWSEVRS